LGGLPEERTLKAAVTLGEVAGDLTNRY
jgi:hypothetical protein